LLPREIAPGSDLALSYAGLARLSIDFSRNNEFRFYLLKMATVSTEGIAAG
jgi:hypothetical protein